MIKKYEERYTEKEFIEKVIGSCTNIAHSAMARSWLSSKSKKTERKISNLDYMMEYEKSTFEIVSRIFSKYIIFANPYKEKGQELCDFIAILNNKVFIFSDKGGKAFDNVSLSDSEVIKRKWKTKCQEITKSNKQLIEAKDWIKRNIKKNRLKIYKDNLCEDAVEFIFKGEPEFFLVSTLNGFSDFAKKKYLNNGSLPINMKNVQSNKKILSIPFRKENLEDKNFIHIFDIEGLKDICKWCNTPVDFMCYLKFRKKTLKEISKNIEEVKQENNILYLYIYKDIRNKGFTSNEIEHILKTDVINNNYELMIRNIDGYSEYKNKVNESQLFDNIISHLFYTGKNGEDNNYENEINYRNKIYDVLFLNRKDRIKISETIMLLERNAKSGTSCEVVKFKNIYLKVIALKMNKDEDPNVFFKRREAYIEKESNKFIRQGIMKSGKIEKAFFIGIDHPKNHILTHAEYVRAIDKSWD